MDIDEIIKYLIWVVFFGIALVGIYVLLKKLGVA
jgi:hypothetical protein